MSADAPRFSWSVSRADGLPTIALVGELDLAVVAEVQPELTSLVAGGGEVTVDLSDLTFIDSSGLKVMLETQRAAERAGCSVGFRRPQAAVRRLLVLTGTEGFFTFTD